MHLSFATALLEGGPAGLERLRQRLPGPPESVQAQDADLLVTRATLALYSGRTQAALADLRAVVALSHGWARSWCRSHAATSNWPRCWSRPGAWDDALLHARIGLALASDEGQPSMQSQCHAVLGTVKACRGEWATAESEIAAATEAANLRGNIEATATAMIAAATLAEARQDPARVISVLHTLPGTVPMLARLAFWPALITALIDDEPTRPGRAPDHRAGAGRGGASTGHGGPGARPAGPTRRGSPEDLMTPSISLTPRCAATAPMIRFWSGHVSCTPTDGRS